MDLVGKTIRDYEILEQVGSGGFGEVYRAYQDAIGREVAIKVILPERANIQEFEKRFDAEARLVAKLEHSHIVPLYDYWRDKDGAYLIMRWLPGGNVRDLLTNGPLDSDQVNSLVGQIGGALALAHKHKVVHRDLKPENILLDEEGVFYLTDFGIAKDLEGEIAESMTGSGIIGTAAYLSPEQAQSTRVTGQSDIYNFGVVIYELLTGEHPFAEADPIAKIMHHINDPLPNLSDKRPDLTAGLDQVIQIATAKKPKKRFDTMDELVAAFRAATSWSSQDKAEIAPGILEKRLGVKAYNPTFLEDQAEKARQAEVFVGRDRQLKQLEGYLNKASSGEGQLVFVIGEAGRGKSALLAEFARRTEIADPDVIILRGSSQMYGGMSDPYLPFRQVLAQLTGDVEEAFLAGELSQQSARRLWNLLPQSTLALVEHGPDLIDTLLPARELASRAAGYDKGGASWQSQLSEVLSRKTEEGFTGEMSQNRLFQQVAQVLHQIAREKTLVVILDDLHWVDQASAAMLAHLSRALASRRILIIGAYRAEEIRPSADGTPHPLEAQLSEFKRQFGDIWLDMGDLESDEQLAFVDAYLETEPNKLGKTFQKQLATHTHGHALFVKELMRDFQARGDLVKDDEGEWVTSTKLTWDHVPKRVEGVIEKRVGRLDDELLSILEIACLQGEEFIGEVIARVLSLEEKEVIKSLSGELCKVHKIVSPHSTHKVKNRRVSVYQFEHNLFQQYLINNIDDIQKVYLHEETGRQLEALYQDDVNEIAAQLARHYLEAGLTKEAVKYLVLSGDKARRLYDVNEALNYYQQALNLANGVDGYSSILERRARILEELYRGEEAVADYENLLSKAKKSKDQKKELVYLLGLARSSYVVALDSAEPDAASKSYTSYRQAYSLAKKLDDKRGMVQALLPIHWFVDFKATNKKGTLVTPKQALQDIKEAVALSESIGEEKLIFDSKIAMQNAFRSADQVEEAEHFGESLLDQLVERGDLLRLNRLYFQLMWTHLARANFDRCVEICDSATALAEKIGIPPVQYAAIKAIALSKSGSFDAAWQSLENEIADENHPFGKAFRDYGSGLYFLDLMAYEQAAEILTSASEQGKSLGRAWMVEGAQEGLAIALLESGNLNKDNLENIRQELDELGLTLPETISGKIDLAAHKFDDALKKATTAADKAKRSGRRNDFLPALELQMRVLLELDRQEEVLLMVDQGIQLAEETGYGTMLWRLLGAKAEALDSIGKQEEAAAQYNLAAEHIQELADTIDDNKLKQGFLAQPHTASVLAKTAKGKQRRSNE